MQGAKQPAAGPPGPFLARSPATPNAGSPSPLAATLRRHRLTRNLTQEDLAGATGLSVRAIRNVELGRVRSPRLESVRRMAKALGLTEKERQYVLDLARNGRVLPTRRSDAVDLDGVPATTAGAMPGVAYVVVLILDQAEGGAGGQTALLTFLDAGPVDDYFRGVRSGAA
jgi:transcriptional regulator with XRE-family HTH domain